MSARWLAILLAAALTCSACGGGSRKTDDWDNIDYTNVYRKAAQREADRVYKLPTVRGCVDDDLFNCR